MIRSGERRDCDRAAGVRSVAPSTTMIDGRLAIRAAIVNHRTGQAEIDTLLEKTLALGRSNWEESRGCDAACACSVAHELHAKGEVGSRVAGGREPIGTRIQFDRSAFPASCLFAELGRLVEATKRLHQGAGTRAYHLAALNNLGSVLIAAGHRRRRDIAFQEAVTRHPDDPTSRVNLGHFLLEESERLTAARRRRGSARNSSAKRANISNKPCACKPDYEKAHEGLSYLLRGSGRRTNGGLAPAQGLPQPLHHSFALSRSTRRRSPCCCWLRRREAMCGCKDFWTIAFSRRLSWSRSSTIPRLRCRRTNWSINAIGDAEVSRGRWPRRSPCSL